jgi:ABC-type antimicrobial peptide transport system permease subunit
MMLPLKFLRWFCKPEYLIDVEGDLLEIYHQRIMSKGRKAATWCLWKDVILLCRPGMIRTPGGHENNLTTMIRHNLLISFRNFGRNRTAFLINLCGLSTGLVCALLILLWVADELSFDKFHDMDERLYRVMVNVPSPAGIHTSDYSPSPLASTLVAEMPEVEYAVSFNPFMDWFAGPGILSNETEQVSAQGAFASKDFFNVFSYKLLQGDKDRVLSDKNGIVISKSLALKLFKTTDNVVGKSVEWNHTMRFKHPFFISGIFDDIPENSTTHFDLIFNYDKLAEGDRYSDFWNATYSQTSVVLRQGADVRSFNEKISDLLITKELTNKGKLFISRYSDQYLYGTYENGVQSGGRISYVKLFSLIAVFILALACINFVNLSTAQASRKMKEVGVKKTVGASGATLVVQFLSESLVLAFLSLAIAVVITIALLPNFNDLTHKHLSFYIGLKGFGGIVALVFVTGIIAGSYPAFYLSRFKPAAILKGKFASTTFGEVFVRQGLVIMQFSISIMFIMAFMIVNKQIDYVQSRNLGYSRENVIHFERRGVLQPNSYETFIHEVKRVRGVANASCMFGSILNMNQAIHNGFSWEGQPSDLKTVGFPSPWVSHDFIETLEIPLKAGRTFSRDRQGEHLKVVVNEEAVRMMGMEDPIGKTVNWGSTVLEIIGVVKDFHYGSLHNTLQPVFFMYAPDRRNIVVKLEAGADQSTLKKLQEVYSKFHPGYPFEFTFLDKDYQALYDSETRVSTLSTYFAIVATLISCLGLFGLAAFTAERRTKEIGIRKVLGATQTGIVRLLATNLTKPVLVAIAIALPVSYFIGITWLSGFAYRIELSTWMFAGAGAVALLVAWITVGVQMLKAARVSPVDSLKIE